MNAAEILQATRRQPFEPFRLVTTDGAQFDIRHPDQCLTFTRLLVLGLPAGPGQNQPEREIRIDLRHVVRIESLQAPVPPGNGS